MEKATVLLGFCFQLGLVVATAVEPFHRHLIVSPQASSEVFYARGQRQIVAPAAAATAPLPAIAPAPHLAFASPAAVAPAPAVVSAAPVTFAAPAPAAPLAIAAPAAVAPAAPLAFAPPAAVAPAAPLAFAPPAAVAPAAPLAFASPAPPVAAAAPVAVAPVVAKVAQFKLSYPQYAYGYSVQDFTTGDNKVAKEVREGGVVKGSYSVADPDGTKRTVNYYADPIHGFNAVVHKSQILK